MSPHEVKFNNCFLINTFAAIKFFFCGKLLFPLNTSLEPSCNIPFSFLIKKIGASFEPSVALASLVQHIPLQMITVLIRSLTTDPNVKDASMTQALCRYFFMTVWMVIVDLGGRDSFLYFVGNEKLREMFKTEIMESNI